MNSPRLYPLVLLILTYCGAFAQLPKVTAVKEFTGIYPSSNSLKVPFHGCVVVDSKLPDGAGEYWLSLNNLLVDTDFSKLEVLVNSERTILGARATFKGTLDDWKGERGYQSRLRVLQVFLGGDGAPLAKTLPLAYDGSEFGGMVFTFDRTGHVSWRVAQGASVINESEYVRRQMRHQATCDECEDISTEARVVLRNKLISEINTTNQPTSTPESKPEEKEKPDPVPDM